VYQKAGEMQNYSGLSGLGDENWDGTTGRNVSGTSDLNNSQIEEDYYDLGYTAGLMAYEVLVEGADIWSMPILYKE
ncbi:MAG: hypothetical protein LUE92_07795, partial [Clostridiales bacterium]|nr:hypothetical protein [Clostridiales bacterium]